MVVPAVKGTTTVTNREGPSSSRDRNGLRCQSDASVRFGNKRQFSKLSKVRADHAQDESYDAAADFDGSLNDCYRAVRDSRRCRRRRVEAEMRRNERFQRIARAYVLATGGRPPANLGDLMGAIHAAIPDVSESELADALAWAIRESKRKEAKLGAAALRGCRR
jgi:hypothetical protein